VGQIGEAKSKRGKRGKLRGGLYRPVCTNGLMVRANRANDERRQGHLRAKYRHFTQEEL
jgi:hypothetical protein